MKGEASFIGMLDSVQGAAAAQVVGALSQSQISAPSSSVQQAQTSPPGAPSQTLPFMPSQASLSAWVVHFMMSAGLSLNGELVKSQLAHIQVDMHLQARVPVSAMPQLRFGQSVP